MSTRGPSGDGWAAALGTVLAGLAAPFVVAVLGLWAAGAADLPDGAFWRVVTAVVAAALGGAVELSESAGELVGTEAGITVLLLSVTLAGALVVGRGFLRPLRDRTVADGPALARWTARIAVLWLLTLLGAALAARHTFEVSLGEGVLDDLGDLFGVSPSVGFTTDVPSTLGFGLLWLAGVLLVADRAPLPGRLARLRSAARPAAYAMVALLLACVAVGVVVALALAATRGRAAQTLAVVLLGLPNLVWPALTVGMGATWDGRVDGPFALPLPRLLDEVLRAPDLSTVSLETLTARDDRAWWLSAGAALLLTAAGCVLAARSPAAVPAWRNAARMACALVLTVLLIGSVGRISARYGLSVPGIGDLDGGLSGELFLRPRLWTALGLAAGWGLVTGFLGTLLTRLGTRR